MFALLAMLLPAAGAAAASELGAPPERPLFRLLGSADGLPSNTVHRLAQDRAGNLWLATLDGLARFDGHGFTVWRHDPDRAGSLPGNDVQQVLVDPLDQVWVSVNDAGVARYRRDSNDFETWRHRAGDDASLPGDRIWALAPDGLGGIWLGGFGTGLARLAIDGRITRHWHDDAAKAGPCSDHVIALDVDPDGTVWIGSTEGLCRWHPDTGLLAVPLVGPGEVTRPAIVADIRQHGGLRWLTTDAGLRALSTTDARTPGLPAELAGVSGWGVAGDADDSLWYASIDGIRRWHPPSGLVQVFPARPGRVRALPAGMILDVLRDREGSLWFAMEGGGIAQLPPRWRSIRSYLPDHDLGPAQTSAGTLRMVQTDALGRVWLAGHPAAGLLELDPASGQVRRWTGQREGGVLPDSRIRGVAASADGTVWTGHHGTVHRWHPDGSRLWQQDDEGRAFPSTPVLRMAQSPAGDILTAFGGGGLAWFRGDLSEVRFQFLGDRQALPCAEITDIRFDRRGATWLACERGLLRTEPGAWQPEAVAGSGDLPVLGLDFAPDDSLWLHRPGMLARYRVRADGRIEQIEAVAAAQGLPAVAGGGVMVDADGRVWLTSQRGLHAWLPEQRTLRVFDEADGLPGVEFARSPPQRLPGGLLVAAVQTGVVVIDTRSLLAPLPVARLRWHEASVQRDGRSVPLDTGTGTLQLRHGDHDLRLAVRLDSFHKPRAQRFRFRLDGADGDEGLDSDGPERVFERLSSGRHALQVSASNSDGQAAIAPLTLLVEVEAPPWRRAPALVVYALSLGLCAVAGQQALRRRLQRRHRRLLAAERQRWAQQASAAKTRFLARVGHELRTPLAGLLGMNALLQNGPLASRQRHCSQSIQQAGEHLLRLVNDLLDLARIESGTLILSPAATPLLDLLDEVLGDVEAAAAGKGLGLSVRIDTPVPGSLHTDRQRLRQVLVNLLGNAIKFTATGRVRLRVDHRGGQLRFLVEDQGPGLTPALRQRRFQPWSQDGHGRRAGGAGLGLAISSELCGLLGADLGARDRDGGGSAFWVSLAVPGPPQWPAAGLPALLLADGDAGRADDLQATLAALGASSAITHPARMAHGPAAATADLLDGPATRPQDISGPGPEGTLPPGALLLAAVDDADALSALRGRYPPGQAVLLRLPLDIDAGDLPAGWATVHGCWRPGALLSACRMLAMSGAGAPEPSGRTQDTLRDLDLLVVEDDPAQREVMATRLAADGAEVVSVDNGLAALTHLEVARFDAVVLDLNLPGLDGQGVLRALGRLQGARMPPVLVVTAGYSDEVAGECLALGARAVLAKPVDPGELARRLRDLVDATASR
ncbi:MAG: response regulator [Xanthomonadales bacterium]|nr:response regulator [Xanthomonadales bacterium]